MDATSWSPVDAPWIDTDASGHILNCHPGAGPLIGYSLQGARGRILPFMFISGRPDSSQLTRAALGHPVELHGVVRPRDRRGIPVRCRIAPAPNDGTFQPVLRWTFTATGS